MLRRTLLLLSSLLAVSLTVHAEPQDSGADPRSERFLKRFPQADTDKDGVLSREEFRAYRRKAKRGNKEAPRTPGIPPDHANVAYGPGKRQVLDLFLAESEHPTPLVIHIHGGGFTGGDKHVVGAPLIKQCRRSGVSVAAINYTFITTDPMPTPMHDAARALQFLRLHAADYNLDPTRFAVTGGSAGAGISLWLAMHDDLADPGNDDPVRRQSTRVSCASVGGAQVSYDPAFWKSIGLDRALEHRSFALMYGHKEDEAPDSPRLKSLRAECAPITHATADDPPILLTYAFPDEVKPDTSMGALIHHPRHGLTLKGKLDALGVECHVNYPGGGQTPTQGLTFLLEHLKPQAGKKDGESKSVSQAL